MMMDATKFLLLLVLVALLVLGVGARRDFGDAVRTYSQGTSKIFFILLCSCRERSCTNSVLSVLTRCWHAMRGAAILEPGQVFTHSLCCPGESPERYRLLAANKVAFGSWQLPWTEHRWCEVSQPALRLLCFYNVPLGNA